MTLARFVRPASFYSCGFKSSYLSDIIFCHFLFSPMFFVAAVVDSPGYMAQFMALLDFDGIASLCTTCFSH